MSICGQNFANLIQIEDLARRSLRPRMHLPGSGPASIFGQNFTFALLSGFSLSVSFLSLSVSFGSLSVSLSLHLSHSLFSVHCAFFAKYSVNRKLVDVNTRFVLLLYSHAENFY
jgi:hypothetical protein